MKKENYRHGDVIIMPTKDVKGELQDKNVLAEGEVTGHSHQITKGNAQLFKYSDKAYLKVKSEIAALTHEEHKKIELPAGDYEVIIQRDYIPDGWKKVVD